MVRHPPVAVNTQAGCLPARVALRHEAADQACQDHGPWMLAFTRPLPILAEAAALLLGALQMPWRTFLPPVIVSNIVIAAAYAVLGAQAAERGWLPLALGASIAAPLAAAALIRRRMRRHRAED